MDATQIAQDLEKLIRLIGTTNIQTAQLGDGSGQGNIVVQNPDYARAVYITDLDDNRSQAVLGDSSLFPYRNDPAMDGKIIRVGYSPKSTIRNVLDVNSAAGISSIGQQTPIDQAIYQWTLPQYVLTSPFPGLSNSQSLSTLPGGYLKNNALSGILTVQSPPIPLADGGTGADLSLTGGTHQFVKQSSAGSAFTVGTISSSDLPTIYYQVIQNNGSDQTQEPKLNFISGTNITLGITDSSGTATNVTINSTGSSSINTLGLVVPSGFSVSPSSLSSSGTFTITLINENPNTFFAGPSTGIAAVPTFRNIVSLDLNTAIDPISRIYANKSFF